MGSHDSMKTNQKESETEKAVTHKPWRRHTARGMTEGSQGRMQAKSRAGPGTNMLHIIF